MKEKMNVVSGIIIVDDEILCLQRPKGKRSYASYKFEFPGGKIEKDESNIEALVRELKEELDIDITSDTKEEYMTLSHEYDDLLITMHCYKVYRTSKDFTMQEHIAYKWLKKEELETIDWALLDKEVMNKLKNEV